MGRGEALQNVFENNACMTRRQRTAICSTITSLPMQRIMRPHRGWSKTEKKSGVQRPESACLLYKVIEPAMTVKAA